MQLPESSPVMSLSLPQAFGLACKATPPLKVRATHRATGQILDFSFNSPYTFIGRSSGAGVRLDDASVSQGHAYLQVIEGVPFCIDLGSRTGVVWDDGTQGQGWVLPEHTLQIGVFDLQVECSGEPRPGAQTDGADTDHDAPPVLTPAAVEIHGMPQAAGANTLHPLDRAITLVGRHPSCDLRLLDSSIAYFQCALVNTTDGVWLVDTMTRKGAMINGRVTRLARARDGDLIEFGKLSLLMRIGSHHGAGLALRTPTPAAVLDPAKTISTAVSESLAGVLVPVGEMMKQFQQCYLSMAQMFAAMQQEHSALVSEQLRQMQDMADELRELRAEVRHNGATPLSASAATPNEPVSVEPTEGHSPPQATPQPRVPTLKVPSGQEGKALSDAHSWFMERLANKGQPPSGS
jgi:pSer/pThr/pTyr-binding forkhead associated (FHA) protein